MNKNTLARNIILLQELENILARFKEKKIEVILLKGCSLLGRIYTDLSQREMEDIDLLVRGENIAQIQGILADLGYRQIPAGDWEFVKTCSEDFPPIMLDLQKDIWYITDTKKIWDESIRVEIGKNEARVLSPEEEIIFLAAYRIVHKTKLEEICISDIGKTVNYYREKICWGELAKKIRNYALEPIVSLVFDKVENIPFWVKNEIKPSGFFAKKLYRLLSSFPEDDYSGHFLRPLTFPTFFGKIKFLFRFFFPGRDFLIRRYRAKNKLAVVFYFFLRPLALIFLGMKTTVNLLSGLSGFHFLSIRCACKKNKVLV